jgi:hypothetical protein
MKTYGKWRYKPTILDLDTRWRCVVRFISREGAPGIHWTSQPVWTLWKRENLAHAGYQTPAVQTIAYQLRICRRNKI